MKRFAWFPVLLALLGIFGAACGTTPPNPLGGATGSGGAEPSGAGVGPVTSVGATTGGGCKPGGADCQAFGECCSGSCANQVCTACGGKGQSCADGCCQGLTCYNDKCGDCAFDNAPCTLASDCCSNVCTQGTCEHCNSLGEFCQSASNCCGGLSCGIDNVCCAKTGGACNADYQCCDGDTCTNGVCGVACKPDGLACTTNASCCGGTCTNGKCGAPVSSNTLGFACSVNANCGAGLKCLTSTASINAFGGGGPANGYCSKDCSTDSECPSGSVCYIGPGQSVGVCLLSCDVGPQLSSIDELLDPNKCNGREDVRCGPLYGATFGCLPTCGRNDQCTAGRVCDPRTALCVNAPSTGLPMGDQCDPMASTPECAGVCVSFGGGTTSCSSPCVLGGDFSDPTAVADCGGLDKGLCAFAVSGNGAGDYAYCAEACKTQDSCQNPSFWCADVGLPDSGYCFGASACPNGQFDCTNPNTCTQTKYGPFCLDAKYPLGTAVP
jgi:hypothetical protein